VKRSRRVKKEVLGYQRRGFDLRKKKNISKSKGNKI